MNLIKVDILGFKSFQNRTTFTFDNNLIGVVGPNGSGKSNIIDAIRWVLGEQSAKNLRGSSMKDVIFSGTESIKGKNFAEVSVTFSNGSEQKEIKRRLYRNGDSEYFINNDKAKLKDISDLYLDLGINKESYSIITQGRVENIISSKPIDRRIIIEEASGVLKYKNKKKETNSKLEKTNDNILRLNDIFSEINSRYEILLEQKNRLETYNDYNEKLQEKDIIINVYNINENDKVLAEIKRKKDRLEKEKKSLEQKQITLLDDLKKIKDSVLSLDNTYLKYHNEQLNLVKEKETLQSEVNIIEERKNNRNLRGEKLAEDRQYLEARKENLKNRLSQTEQSITHLKVEINSINNKISLLETGQGKNSNELEKELENLKDSYYELINEETRLENSIDYKRKSRQNNDENLRQLTDNVTTLEQNIAEKKKGLEQLVAEKTKNTEQLVAIEKSLDSSNNDNIKLSLEEKALNEQLKKGYDFQNSLNNKKKFLEGQIDNLSLYNRGVKEILSNKDSLTGVHNSIANLVTFNNSYGQALDTALSLAQQNIVVDDEQVAKKCIEHLKRTNSGRVTFLPLSNIREKFLAPEIYNAVKNEQGFIDVAENLVTYNAKYKKIISHLLGLILIVDTLDNANKIARKISFKNRIITLDGQVINAGGSITGGAINRNNNSSIKTKAELTELQENLLKVDDKVRSIEQSLNKVVAQLKISLEEIENKKLDKENITFKVKELELKESVLVSEIENLQTTLEKEKFKLQSYEIEHISFDSISTEESRLEEIREQLKITDDKIKYLNVRINDAQLVEDNQVEQISNLKIEKTKCEETLKNNLELKESITVDLGELNEQFEKLELATKNDNLSEEDEKSILTNNSKLIEQHSKRLSVLEQLLFDLDFEKTDLLKKEKVCYKEQQQNNEDLKTLTDELEKVMVSKTKLEVKIDEYLQTLVTKYEKTYESLLPLLTEEAKNNINNYQLEVEDLRRKIATLGNVNLNAGVEFAEIETRYNFYSSQLSDLKNAKESLEQTIKEIDKEVEERFLETFVEIAKNFDSIFKELFKGGYASMALEKPNDILNTGIIIEASPPGKKLQNLSLLSGGEKSLTAISLLFAVLKVKNSPFVILDEVEAALDEVNITRFAKFLKIYAQDNQFLVITHRRGTMEAMDKLYGVTMKEKGISYVLPLELNDIIEKGEYK